MDIHCSTIIISAFFMSPIHILAATLELELGHNGPSVQRRDQKSKVVLFSATVLTNSRTDIFRHTLDYLSLGASESHSISPKGGYSAFSTSIISSVSSKLLYLDKLLFCIRIPAYNMQRCL